MATIDRARTEKSFVNAHLNNKMALPTRLQRERERERETWQYHNKSLAYFEFACMYNYFVNLLLEYNLA